MCGVVGGTGIAPERIARSLETIAHRGPDARGTWFAPDGNVAFGHARLSIIDLDASANQPMICARTGNVISFNGEIYNYRAVRGELAKAGWSFRTHSDTEVLLAAFGEWGPECLHRLNGMFAFAIYDPRRKRIFLARDRVGKKPLYYSLWNDQICWASELKALLTLRPEIPREIDYAALREYSDLNYIPGELSIYRHARKLLPAHYAIYDLGSRGFSAQRYWTLPEPADHPSDENEAAEELEALLQDAVRIRLESDVPVGVFLSGGLDSSLVSAIALKQKPDLIAYTAKFPVARYDETPIAAKVASWIGAAHHVLPIDAEDGGALDKLAWQFDEPFADSSLFPTFLISSAIRKHVTVALSGDGGDELFGGYDFYTRARAEARWDVVPSAVRTAAGSINRLMPLGTRGKNYLRRLPRDGVERFLFMGRSPEHIEITPFAGNPSGKLAAAEADAYRHSLLESLRSGPRAMSLLQLMTRLDFFSYLPDDILVKVDRASMLTSLEVRAPLLDYRIAEFAYRLPDRLRVSGTVRKYILKKVARKYLPPDFPYERKQGFSIPEGQWFRKQWRSVVEQASKNSSLIDRGNLAELLRLNDKSERYGRLLFNVLMLAEFEKNWKVTA